MSYPNWILIKKRTFRDQDTQNMMYNDSVKFLHPKFNLIVDFNYEEKTNKEVIYKNFDLSNLKDEAFIIHYAGNKPWVYKENFIL